MPGSMLEIYRPDRQFKVDVHDEEYLDLGGSGGKLLARVYQPDGEGPFPLLVDVHGGAWNGGSRTSNKHIDTELATSGIVVVALDFRVAPSHRYPCQVTDVNYAVRWLKTQSGRFKALNTMVGLLGTSSGGHTVMLTAMKPNDRTYSEIGLASNLNTDASVAYIIAMWSVLDPWARYEYARQTQQERLVNNTEAYFGDVETMKKGNPQYLLDSGERLQLPPTLIIQGTADLNIPMTIPERFFESYRKRGGDITLETFPGMPHSFANSPGPEADRAIQISKKFIERQVAPTGIKN